MKSLSTLDGSINLIIRREIVLVQVGKGWIRGGKEASKASIRGVTFLVIQKPNLLILNSSTGNPIPPHPSLHFLNPTQLGSRAQPDSNHYVLSLRREPYLSAPLQANGFIHLILLLIHPTQTQPNCHIQISTIQPFRIK